MRLTPWICSGIVSLVAGSSACILPARSERLVWMVGRFEFADTNIAPWDEETPERMREDLDESEARYLPTDSQNQSVWRAKDSTHEAAAD